MQLLQILFMLVLVPFSIFLGMNFGTTYLGCLLMTPSVWFLYRTIPQSFFVHYKNYRYRYDGTLCVVIFTLINSWLHFSTEGISYTLISDHVVFDYDLTWVENIAASDCVPSYFYYDIFEWIYRLYLTAVVVYVWTILLNFIVDIRATYRHLIYIILVCEVYMFGLSGILLYSTAPRAIFLLGLIPMFRRFPRYSYVMSLLMICGVPLFLDGYAQYNRSIIYQDRMHVNCIQEKVQQCFPIPTGVLPDGVVNLITKPFRGDIIAVDGPSALNDFKEEINGDDVTSILKSLDKYDDALHYFKTIMWVLYFVKNDKMSKKEIVAFVMSQMKIRHCTEFIRYMHDFHDDEIVAADNVFDKAEKFISKARESPAFAKSSRFIMGCMALPLIDMCGLQYSKSGMSQFLKKNAIKSQFSNPVDALLSALQMLSAVTETGKNCFRAKSLSPIFEGDDEIMAFVSRYEEIEEKLRLQFTNPDFNAADLYSEMKCVEKDGRALLKKEFSHLVNSCLKNLSTKLTLVGRAASHCSMRRPPIGVLYYSPPGQGKSSIIKMTVEYYHSVVENMGKKLEYSPEVNVFTQNPADDFQSGYQGSVHWAMILDDIAYETKDIVKMTGGKTLKNLIMIMNCVGYASNQAELEKKGVVPFNPRLVVATTNVKNLNARYAVNEPLAILRRFPLVVTPFIDDKFLNEGKLEMKKEIIDGEEVYSMQENPWKYKVEIVTYNPSIIEDGRTKWDYKLIHEGMDAKAYWKYLGEYFVSEEKKADVLVETFKADPKNRICTECGTMTKYCDCIVAADGYVSHEPLPQEYVNLCKERGIQVGQTVQDEINRWRGRVSISETVTKSTRFLSKVIDVFDYILDTHYMRKVTDRIEYSLLRIGLRLYSTAYPSTKSWFLMILNRFFPVFTRKLFILGVERRRPDAMRKFRKTVRLLLGVGGIFAFFKAYYFLTTNDHEASAGIWTHSDETFKVNNKVQKRSDADELIHTLTSSMVRLTVYAPDDEGRTVSGLNIGDGRILTVAHVFGDAECWNIGFYYGKRQNVSSNQGGLIVRDQVTFIGNDLAIITTGLSIPRKDIRPWFQEKWRPNGRCKLVSVDINGIIDVMDGRILSYSAENYKRTRDDTIYSTRDGVNAAFDRDIKPGDCGSILLVEHRKGWMIHSMVVASRNRVFQTSTGHCSIISKEQFENEGIYAFSGDLSIPSRGNEKLGRMGPLSASNKHQWAGEIHGEMLGSYPNIGESSSNVTRSEIADKIYEAFPKLNEYGPPKMKKVKQADGSYFDPEVVSIKQCGKPKFKISEAMFAEAASGFFNRLKKHDLSSLRPLSLKEAINGVAGNDYLNRIPMSTSGGIYKSGPKIQCFIEVDGVLMMDEELQEAYDEAMALYSKGHRAHFPFKGSLKDEPVKTSKLKTRVFTAASLPFTIIERQQFLTVAEWFMRNNLISECAAGLNCYSTAWNDVYEYLTFEGTALDTIGDGDYAHFDKDIMAMCIRIAFRVLTSLCQESGNYSDLDILIQKGIATDLSYPLIAHHGDVMMHYAGHCSGHSMTVIINSIVNSLYMRMCFMLITGLPAEEFDEYIRLITLGDDNAWNSKHPEFNHITISEAMKEFGLTYTMADKEAESVPFRNIKDITFLKRSFRYVEGRMVAPLELESILKSFVCFEDRGNITYPEQLAQVYLAALREASLHGEIMFNLIKSKLEPIVKSVPCVDLFLHPRVEYPWRKMFDWVTLEEDDYVEPQVIGDIIAVSGEEEEWIYETDTDEDHELPNHLEYYYECSRLGNIGLWDPPRPKPNIEFEGEPIYYGPRLPLGHPASFLDEEIRYLRYVNTIESVDPEELRRTLRDSPMRERDEILSRYLLTGTIPSFNQINNQGTPDEFNNHLDHMDYQRYGNQGPPTWEDYESTPREDVSDYSDIERQVDEMFGGSDDEESEDDSESDDESTSSDSDGFVPPAFNFERGTVMVSGMPTMRTDPELLRTMMLEHARMQYREVRISRIIPSAITEDQYFVYLGSPIDYSNANERLIRAAIVMMHVFPNESMLPEELVIFAFENLAPVSTEFLFSITDNLVGGSGYPDILNEMYFQLHARRGVARPLVARRIFRWFFLRLFRFSWDNAKATVKGWFRRN